MSGGRPYLDYYIEQGIIPVQQDISDLAAHFRRRAFLYRSLQIPPGAMRHARVLEFGPGTGDNAVYVASLRPKTYVLVDGNPYSIAAVKERAADARYDFSWLDELQIIESDILKFEDPRRFDIVLCEGVIPGQRDGKAFLRQVAGFADSDSIVVATTQSATSMLAEVCRHLVKPVFAARGGDPGELADRLSALFAPHLATLPGRSRVVRDWVNDNILQAWPETLIFTIEDAIDAIGDGFDVYGTSPRFIQDFRWYKAAAVDGIALNNVARAETAKWSPIFLDYRLDPAEFKSFDGVALERECLAILIDVHQAWTADDFDLCGTCVERIARLGDWIAPAFPRTAQSIRDFTIGMTGLLAGKPTGFGDFESWFGRGQQYVSFIRQG
ncbi:MAG TPA: class I SAM-dependent methyltransferase [Rhodanobacter sp.]|nr:class I SAM-dependent methyltransferase [Rhodanobacter sp.]